MACASNPIVLMDIKVNAVIYTLKLELFNHLYPAFVQIFQKFTMGFSAEDTDDSAKSKKFKFKFRISLNN